MSALEMADGTVREARQDHIRGGVEAPLSRAEIDAKFLANARYGGVARPERLLGLCTELLRSPDAGAVMTGLADMDEQR